jgi:hypothetical protein
LPVYTKDMPAASPPWVALHTRELLTGRGTARISCVGVRCQSIDHAWLGRELEQRRTDDSSLLVSAPRRQSG